MNLHGQGVVIFGATGGLGQAIATRFANEGARLMLVGRRTDILQPLSTRLSAQWVEADITDTEAIGRAREQAAVAFGSIHLVVNAAGYDVRKPLLDHSDADIQQTLDINLSGAIRITRAFLPMLMAQHQGTIVHLGGFGDGRLAFPFYSVDVASRAGLRGFVESVNRELHALHQSVRVVYFGPTSADTDAERPYAGLWQEMGIPLASPDAIADALLYTLSTRKTIAVMGMGTRFITLVNAVAPKLADWLILRRYGQILRRHLAVQPL